MNPTFTTAGTTRVLNTAVLTTLWLASAAAGLAADAGSTIVVDAELLQKSEGMTRVRIAPYHEGLVIYEWRVLNVSTGALAAKTIRVAHWGFYDDLPQDILNVKTGATAKAMALVPFDKADALMRQAKQVDSLPEDFDAALFCQINQALKVAPIDNKRWKDLVLKIQDARIVVVGDSRAESGIDTQFFRVNVKNSNGSSTDEAGVGGTSGVNGPNATANTGGGGGGGGVSNTGQAGGNGGSGIVIVRYVAGGGVQATGGTITNYTLNDTHYRAHLFTTVGTTSLTVSAAGAVEVLVVAGGGGGGSSDNGSGGGGGGGAGGLISQRLTLNSNTRYAVTVGKGGTGGAANSNNGEAGENSVFGNLVTLGGGRGDRTVATSSGGSGAGGFGRGGAGGAGTQPRSASGGHGNNGGGGGHGGGGGGGGSGSVGSVGGEANGGNGGSGSMCDLSGRPTGYAGGGGGGCQSGSTYGTATDGGGNGGAAGADGPQGDNLAVASSGLLYADLILKACVERCPHVKWVVYGVSSRTFNQHWVDVKGKELETSPGFKVDQARSAQWGQSATAKLEQLGKPRFGAVGAGEIGMGSMTWANKSFVMDPERLKTFESILARLWNRNIGVLAFTPPWQKGSNPAPFTDDDGTASADYDNINEIMRELEKKYPNFRWLDINNKAEHDFTNDYFTDSNHLNPKGAEKLTKMLDAEIQRLEEKERAAQ